MLSRTIALIRISRPARAIARDAVAAEARVERAVGLEPDDRAARRAGGGQVGAGDERRARRAAGGSRRRRSRRALPGPSGDVDDPGAAEASGRARRSGRARTTVNVAG